MLRIVVLLICLLSSLVHAQPVGIDKQHARIELWPHLQVLSDPPGDLTPEAVALRLHNGLGHRIGQPDVSFGGWIPHPYWAGFSLNNPHVTPQSRLLSFELPTQDYTQLWQRSADGTWQPVPELYAQEPLQFGTGNLWPVWRVELVPGETREFLLRIDGYNRMRFPLAAVREDAFMRQQILLYLGIGFVFAVPCVVVFHVLSLTRAANDKSVPLFLLMAACEMLGAAWVSGLLTALLPWVPRALAGWIGWCGYVLVLALSCRHAQIFMDTAVHDRLAHRLLQAGKLFWFAIVPAIVLAKPNTSRLFLLIGGTVHAAMLAGIAVGGFIRRPQPHMALFVAVWSVYLGSGVLYVLYRIFQLPVYITLTVNYIQGSLVAALLGWAVSLQVQMRRQQMVQQVQQAQDRALLYATAQHDLMQPLQSVQLHAQTLVQASPQELSRLMVQIRSAVHTAMEFMHTLRHLHHEGQRQVELHWQTLAVHQAVGPVVEEMRVVARAKSIHLRYRPCNGAIRVDVNSLQRIVRNLLSNAIRYTPAGGDILIACRRRQGKLWLLCLDNGIGMSAEQVQRCFDAFERFGHHGADVQGLGLGLYSVKQLAQAMGLPIRLASMQGRGTTVAIGLYPDPGMPGKQEEP